MQFFYYYYYFLSPWSEQSVYILVSIFLCILAEISSLQAPEIKKLERKKGSAKTQHKRQRFLNQTSKIPTKQNRKLKPSTLLFKNKYFSESEQR